MANNVNTQLRENPRLQRMPTDQREWHFFVNELSKWVADITTSGRFSTDTLFPQLTLANSGSVQDSPPVSATDAGASATVNIASHILYRQSEHVTYNSGSITGLSYSTRYFIYTDDPDYEGGSVTYLASTTKDDIVGAMGRYYLGEIKTPAAAESDTTGSPGAGFGTLQFDFTDFEDNVKDNIVSGTNADVTAVEGDVTTLSGRVTVLEGDLAASDPVYTVTNDATDRGFDANAAAGAISSPPTQAEVEGIRDAVLELADVLGTLIADFQTKDVLG